MKKIVLLMFLLAFSVSGCNKTTAQEADVKQEEATQEKSETLQEEIPEEEAVEEEPSYKIIENAYPKGTIEEYRLPDDSKAHYVVKLHDDEVPYELYFTCDLPYAEKISTSFLKGDAGQFILGGMSKTEGNNYSFGIYPNQLTVQEFEEFAGYTKEEFLSYFVEHTGRSYSEDGYYHETITEDLIRVTAELEGQSGNVCAGIVLDKAQGLKYKYNFGHFGDEEGYDKNAIIQAAESICIVNEDYTEQP